ncbi:hypothetical protein EPI10_014514 [Gossypium australe]|uniref:Uncharacterized protein n=1 Tax=Gossypium australe TaxID=47621 RepID=A0A5B6VHH6_9ROSI|nr:hypothetical protein EPI10_014514 [Gossypium australe]
MDSVDSRFFRGHITPSLFNERNIGKTLLFFMLLVLLSMAQIEHCICEFERICLNQIRRKMRKSMINQASSYDLKELVRKILKGSQVRSRQVDGGTYWFSLNFDSRIDVMSGTAFRGCWYEVGEASRCDNGRREIEVIGA